MRLQDYSSSFLLNICRGHLYRHHSIFPCPRCKVLFKDQDAVNRHVIQPKSCEVRDIEHADGVTMEIVAKLRSKKKTQQGHTEADRWKHIYRLLFPNEMIPSPCKFPPQAHRIFNSGHNVHASLT